MSTAAIDKAYEPAQVEPAWARRWLEAGAFAPRAGSSADARPYVVLLPPPNVTGVLHMGHMLNNIIQVLHRPVTAATAQRAVMFQLCHRPWVGRRQIRIDDAGLRMRAFP